MVARNPFLVTSPIYTDADFVGRESDLRRLFEVVSGPQPQSLCIYGERRIGKSSLLHAFERRAAATLSPADRYLVLSYDIAQAATPGELVLQLIERVSRARRETPAQTTSTTALTDLIDRVATEGQRLVVLMDDFDEIVRNRRFTVDTFNFLRSLVSNQPVSMVLTSRQRLIDVCHEEVKGSPFFNVFHERRLDVFTPGDAALLLGRATALGVDLAPYRPWIASVAGTFPLFMQIACALAFDLARESGGRVPSPDDLDRLSDSFADQVEPHYLKLWTRFTAAEREVLADVARKTHAPLPQDVRQGLVRRGYLAGSGRLFSTTFEQFVRTRAGSGHVSPPCKDRAQGPAALNLFVSYAHEDAEFLAEGSLLGYLSGLQRHGVTFWDDRQIPAGADWKSTIVHQLERADLALVLVSQYWLNSPFVLDEELSRIMHLRAKGALHVIPVLVSPCMWEADPWVSSLQLLPSRPKGPTPLSAVATDRGEREAAFLSVLRALRGMTDKLRQSDGTPAALRATAG